MNYCQLHLIKQLWLQITKPLMGRESPAPDVAKRLHLESQPMLSRPPTTKPSDYQDKDRL